jgi:hypothetical protein
MGKWWKIHENAMHLLILKQCGDLVLNRAVGVANTCHGLSRLCTHLQPLLAHIPPLCHEWIHFANNSHEFPDVTACEWGSSALDLGCGFFRRRGAAISLVLNGFRVRSSGGWLEKFRNSREIGWRGAEWGRNVMAIRYRHGVGWIGYSYYIGFSRKKGLSTTASMREVAGRWVPSRGKVIAVTEAAREVLEFVMGNPDKGSFHEWILLLLIVVMVKEVVKVSHSEGCK